MEILHRFLPIAGPPRTGEILRALSADRWRTWQSVMRVINENRAAAGEKEINVVGPLERLFRHYSARALAALDELEKDGFVASREDKETLADRNRTIKGRARLYRLK